MGWRYPYVYVLKVPGWSVRLGLFFSVCKLNISLVPVVLWYWMFLSTSRSQKRTDLREEASALYCLREMTIVSLLTLKFLISSLKWQFLLKIHEAKRSDYKPNTQNRINRTFCISLFLTFKHIQNLTKKGRTYFATHYDLCSSFKAPFPIYRYTTSKSSIDFFNSSSPSSAPL